MFYFATSRQVRDNHFTAELGTETLYFMTEAPAAGAFPLSRADWLRKVRGTALTEGLLVYVHGFNTDVETMVKTLMELRRRFALAGWRGGVVAYSWPSIGKLLHPDWPDAQDTLTFRADREMAPRAAPALVRDLLIPLATEIGPDRLHLLAHSMGTYLVLNALKVPGDWRFGEAIFISAELERAALSTGSPAAQAMARHSRRLSFHYSTEDRVLDLAKLFYGGRRRAGALGIRRPVPPSTHQVAGAARFLSINPWPHPEVRHSHAFWTSDGMFIADAALTMRGTPAGQMKTRDPLGGGTQQLKPRAAIGRVMPSGAARSPRRGSGRMERPVRRGSGQGG